MSLSASLALVVIYISLHDCRVLLLIAQACTDIRPAIIITVPMVVEKIIRKNVFPKVQSTATRMLLKMPVVSKKVKERISAIVMEAFGAMRMNLLPAELLLTRRLKTSW